MSTIDLSKARVGDKGKTRDGRIVELKGVDIRSEWPFHFQVVDSERFGNVNHEGYLFEKGEPSDFDIVEFPLKPEPAEMEPFDLERAKAGEHLIDEDGDEYTWIGISSDKSNVLESVGTGSLVYWNAQGQGLFMAPKPKRKFWINVYDQTSFTESSNSREDLDVLAKNGAYKRIACIEVTEGDGL